MATYKGAGVNIEEGYKSVNLMKEHVRKTFNKGVLNGIGSFAAMYELGKYKNPVLVSGTDGVGTKLKIAFELEKYNTIGIDCVAMCVNDILCHGAKPLFFLDYMACGKLKGEVAADIVKGVSDGCLRAGCALIGGETAEMPGFYKEGEYDIAGFAVGIVEKENIVDGQDIKEGDVLIGIASSGVHSNGYSLVRSVIKDFRKEFHGKIIGEEFLTPTKIYVKPVLQLLKSYPIKGMAHITGGGFYENIPRMFKDDLNVVISKNSFPRPDIFEYIISKGIEENHMFNVFNMGIGFVLCVDPCYEKKIIEKLIEQGEKAYKIGHIEKGERKVIIK
ncbi:phosphoribosylformylglycinamidine cyclo-ligase [Clostridium tetani]|uniref:phosphoribosylformylglycinamidine cyclo-ligase n=1 Tax=Clostridium tetani TaxID=1513 RepID=UPI000E16DEC2|nr:phosphoribosylformylglycinamidine cyclo-ligase [Clostridium tetani]RXI50823.1 phosphoribosylformylglycinamidine cyclo-ligase [Clostridium tetani]RXI52510.1 phosphoribosylformylglycinamidine cyclo-ligase [Clostridium tetani]RXI78426.1 phosphoribosylformylglycinamidine cyclo-ligase [Clostridium tetani]RXM69832.1 phosphoribosylformylglycinamidine cyclo-ligase [Clostridium tetani]WFN61298.1 phosphoribosylformylglycinamidine cyclo-ligase [Clostridium tetani]